MYAKGLLDASGPKRVVLPNREKSNADNDVEREPQPPQADRRPRHRRAPLIALSNLGNRDIAKNYREGARDERGNQPDHGENVERFSPVRCPRRLGLDGDLRLWSFTHPLRVIVAG